MAVRWYAALAVLLALAFLCLAADRAGLVRLPWRPAPEAGLHSATLRATWTIDLESGEQGTPQADVHWGMAAPDQPYLGVVQRGSGRGALIAAVGDLGWENLDEPALAKLNYAVNRYSAWGPDAPVHKGAVFAVRTLEGNFAKLRVAEIGNKYQVRLEWLLYARAAGREETISGQTAREAARPGPSRTWLAARDEALAAYRAKHYQEALDACGKAVATAGEAGAEQRALALVTCGGLMELHRRAAQQIEDWLKEGVAIAMKLDQQAIAAALGPREFMLKEHALRMLGIFYRGQNRPRDAAENFALAVDTVRAMPPLEMGAQRLALRADLYDLGITLAQLGLRGTARRAFEESRELYLKTEPEHPALKEIDERLARLEDPARDPDK